MAKVRKKQITVGFHPKTYRQLSEAAEQFETTINEIVRECVDNDLPKLVERVKKRQTRRTNIRL